MGLELRVGTFHLTRVHHYPTEGVLELTECIDILPDVID